MRSVLTCGLLLSLTAAAAASVVEYTYEFDAPRVVPFRDYHVIVFEDTYSAGEIGTPTLPFRGMEILLPPGEAVFSIEVSPQNPVTLEGSYRLLPQQSVRPTSSKPSGTWVVNEAVYASDTPWPRQIAPTVRTNYANGLAIATGAFTPLVYLPHTGTVTYYREVTIRLHTEVTDESRRALAMLPTSFQVMEAAASRTNNPEMLASYAPRPSTRDDAYEYLIITRETYHDDFQPLADFYNRRGIRTKIKTIEFIETNYSGADTPEEIRMCIADEYLNHSVSWVLLGGDADGPHDEPGQIVPYRGLSATVISGGWPVVDHHIPADCYFAGLDGSWNADGDTLWGESGEEDFYAEVHVGRLPVDREAEIATFITKTIRYQTAPVTTEIRSALFLGEHLYEDPLTWGGDMLDELTGSCSSNGFTTQGVPLSYSLEKLYDREAEWDSTEMISAINAGVHLVCHNGHANGYYCMKTRYFDVTDETFLNDGVSHSYCILYTQGCLVAAFDNFASGSWYHDYDCIAERMHLNEHFCVSLVANTRYGWFTEGTTNGPGQHYNREFVDAIFGEGFTTIGAANTRSKDETVPFIDLPDEYEPGAHRWQFYSTNVLGDPALDIWTDTPGTMTVSAPGSIETSATAVTIETGVPGALVALSRDTILYGRAFAAPSGDAEVTFAQSISAVDSLELVVTAHDYLTFESRIPVVDYSDVPPADQVSFSWGLAPCNPNPFFDETSIMYSLQRKAHVSLRVLDVGGRAVARLVNDIRPAGHQQLTWSPALDVAPGVYFLELRADDFAKVRRILLIR
ncbi:MAG: hypothetical protein KAY32_00315 [Candidatus Eisenbacteria sp.]|nr:hypothetical protein [Candidatus Eisenbacteria bacterium]